MFSCLLLEFFQPFQFLAGAFRRFLVPLGGERAGPIANLLQTRIQGFFSIFFLLEQTENELLNKGGRGRGRGRGNNRFYFVRYKPLGLILIRPQTTEYYSSAAAAAINSADYTKRTNADLCCHRYIGNYYPRHHLSSSQSSIIIKSPGTISHYLHLGAFVGEEPPYMRILAFFTTTTTALLHVHSNRCCPYGTIWAFGFFF